METTKKPQRQPICPDCRGTGKASEGGIAGRRPDGTPRFRVALNCANCKGSGRVAS